MLVSADGRSLCYACIADGLHVRVHAIRGAALFLGPAAFDRRLGPCDGCRAGDRLVIAHTKRETPAV